MSLETVFSSMQGKAQSLMEGAGPGERTEGKQQAESRSFLNEAVHKVVGTVWQGESNTRDEIESYASQFITAVPLFVGGGRGLAASAALFGLNQAKVGDTYTHQIEDFGLGALKGASTKLAFDYLGAKKNWNFATKGVGMGSLSRGLDVALNRQTWFDPGGVAQPLAGLEATAMTMFHPFALAADVTTFGASHFGGKFGNFLTKGAIEASPFLQNTFTGTTFGLTSGALGEVHRQLNDPKAHFDPWQILLRSGAGALTTSAAAASGFGLTDRNQLPVVKFESKPLEKPDLQKPEASKNEAQTTDEPGSIRRIFYTSGSNAEDLAFFDNARENGSTVEHTRDGYRVTDKGGFVVNWVRAVESSDNPYLAEFNQLAEPSQTDQLIGRRQWVKKYSWAIPNEEALQAIVGLGPVVEIGAGTGYWAHLLQMRGAHVDAYDLHPVGEDSQNKFHAGVSKSWTNVQHGDASVAAKYGPEYTLMLSWPPYGDPMAAEALGHFKGNRLVYIGEPAGGCTGGGEFHNMLESDWDLVRQIEIPRYEGMHDDVSIYVRKVPK